MIRVSELIQKLTLCPMESVVVYANEFGSGVACSISADVYGEATATPTDSEEQAQVVVLLPDVPSDLESKLADMTADRDRWLARVHKLERRLNAIQANLSLE